MNAAKMNNMLNVLCPMHVIFNHDGKVEFAGPTMQKICDGKLVGQHILEVFEIKRPREITTMDALCERTGKRMNLSFRAPPYRRLQGVLMEGPDVGQMVLNLSFGISIVEAVQEYDLTAADFAPTDLTVEMLYLVEAKSAAMEASRQLNERLQSARVQAEEQALTDTLTGLRNRRAMDQSLSMALSSDQPFSLMHADLDFFKSVNDTLGHAAGDHVLQEVARIMNDETREADVVARVGGDEFVILVQGSEDNELLDRIAQRIIARLQIPIPFDGEMCRISGSVGTVVSGSYQNPTADLMLGDADAALYAAKHAGRGCHIFFAPHMRETTKIA
ncbi:MAG: diguanylate cyclase [Roseobacter sp.]